MLLRRAPARLLLLACGLAASACAGQARQLQMPPAEGAEVTSGEEALARLRRAPPPLDPRISVARRGEGSQVEEDRAQVLLKALGGLSPRLQGQVGRHPVPLSQKARSAQATVQAPQLVGVGQLSVAAIFQVSRRRQRAALYCYERQLAKEPQIKGEITLRYTINNQGRVPQSAVVSDKVHTQVATCLQNIVRRLRFPTFQGPEIEVEQVWVFSP